MGNTKIQKIIAIAIKKSHIYNILLVGFIALKFFIYFNIPFSEVFYLDYI